MEIQQKIIGLIGLGYWGKNILRNLQDLGVLHTACDSDPGIVAERKKGFPGLHFTTSLNEMLRNPDIKAMAISTPAATHYELAKKSLLAGKDVFVEKCQGSRFDPRTRWMTPVAFHEPCLFIDDSFFV